MKPTIEIYIGSPVTGSEARALQRLHSDLSRENVDAIIFVNFTAKGRQIDCVVITQQQASLLEWKEITGQIRGGLNGRWWIRARGGQEVRYPGENPYVEAVGAKFALSDEMAKFKAAHPEIPGPLEENFYRQFDAIVCICPDVVTGSRIPVGDFKCLILGYPSVFTKIVDRRIATSWLFDHWRRFAKEHLSLEGTSLASAVDASFRKAELITTEYRTKLKALLCHKLPPELPDTAESLPCNEHFVLIGPAGMGKTTRLQHYAARLSDEGKIVIFTEAKYYAGDFRTLLQKAVAPCFAEKIEDLLQSVTQCAAGFVLIVDGFNQCRESLRANLLRDAVAFFERYAALIAISSQYDPSPPNAIRSKTMVVGPVTARQKEAVFRYYAGIDMVEAAWLQPFRSLHDVMVAAKCLQELGSTVTRTELYDTYILKCVPEEHAAVAAALLRHLAWKLTENFGFAMSVHEFEKEGESFLEKSGATLNLLDKMRSSSLIELTSKGFSFSHELIHDHLYADFLTRHSPSFESLRIGLKKPINRNHVGAVASRITSDDQVREILQAVPDSALLDQGFDGLFGPIVQRVIRSDCHSMLTDAAADLGGISVDLKIEPRDGREFLEWPDLKDFRQWSAYESALAGIIGAKLDTSELRDPVTDLLEQSGKALCQASVNAARQMKVSSRSAFDMVLHSTLLLSHGIMRLPIERILQVFDRLRFNDQRNVDEKDSFETTLLSRIEQKAFGGRAFIIFTLCKAHERRAGASPDTVERLFAKAWEMGLRSLKIQALEMLQHCALSINEANPACMERIKSMLPSLEVGNDDPVLSTCFVDTLNAFGLVTPPVTLDYVLAQMRGIIDSDSQYAREICALSQAFNPDSTRNPLAEIAAAAIGNFFEDILQGVYWEAFEMLTGEEKLKLLHLAAQASKNEFSRDYILGELVERASLSSLPTFQRYASKIEVAGSFCVQSAVSVFVLAVVGCAKLSEELPPWPECQDPLQQAWGIVRQIIFEHIRTGPSPRIHELWLSLRAETPFAATDVLYELERAGWISQKDDFAMKDLLKWYGPEIREILEHNVVNLDKAPCPSFIVSTLGQVGTVDTIPLLKRLAEGEHGAEAIAAIKAIRLRE